MSYRIEYDWVAVRLPKQRIESAYEDHFILASLGGDNNIYSRDGKRPRSWSCMALGMHWEVMQRAVEFSAACEGGSLKPHGRWMSSQKATLRACAVSLTRHGSLTMHGVAASACHSVLISTCARCAIATMPSAWRSFERAAVALPSRQRRRDRAFHPVDR
jgi:hypothetical protein